MEKGKYSVVHLTKKTRQKFSLATQKSSKENHPYSLQTFQ